MTSPFLYLKKIATAVNTAEGKAYLVGGAVRSWLSNQQWADDLDVALFNCNAEQIARQLADDLKGHFLVLDPDFQSYRVVLADKTTTLDITQGLENDLNTDLARRDLTINAMAIELHPNMTETSDSLKVIDPYQGQRDLRDKRIKMLSEKNLLEDPLRLLRVFRFGASIDADDYAHDTLNSVATHQDKLLEAAPERIQQEFFKLLSAEPCFAHLKLMADIGLLEVILPEMTPMHAIPANGFHHLGLFQHTLELVKQSETLIHQFNETDQAYFRSSFNPMVKRFGLIKLACLLHDVGKPNTLGEKGERLTFYGHDKESETMTGTIGKRLKLGKEVTQYVQKLVRWHLYPCHFGDESPRKSILRFLNRIGDEVPDLLLLSLSDRHSTRSEQVSDEDIKKAEHNHFYLLNRYYEERAVITAPPILSGKEVMTLLNISEGPKIGDMMRALKEAQQNQGFASKSEAALWLKGYFNQ